MLNIPNYCTSTKLTPPQVNNCYCLLIPQPKLLSNIFEWALIHYALSFPYHLPHYYHSIITIIIIIIIIIIIGYGAYAITFSVALENESARFERWSRKCFILRKKDSTCIFRLFTEIKPLQSFFCSFVYLLIY